MRKFRVNKKILIIIIIILITIVFFVIQNVIEDNEEANNILYDESFLIENDETIEDDIDEREIFSEDIAEDVVAIEEDEKLENEVVEEEKIYVYVTGAVYNPGVVILNKGSRICDAIDSAGGATNKADISKVNLVFVLEDGMKVNIPSSDDLKKDSDFEFVVKGSGDGKEDVINNEFDNEVSSKDVIVNINSATQTELETLPGIGPSLALNIINYRNENGKFSSIEDIKNVSGIGESKFDNIKDLICV